MITLREQIKEKHDIAENSPFTKLLLSGNISKEIYGDFLYNQKLCYIALEQEANSAGLLKDFPEICREKFIQKDLLDFDSSKFNIYYSTIDYAKHVNSLNGSRLLLAHIYVRHFGDMYGGQMIKKVIPSKGYMYEFENRKELIDKVRAVLTDDLGDEANICFDFAIKLFVELAYEYNL